eukprot:Lithocolla_globosa_v1_NODE_2589_length_1942_cov_15.472178.p2 type:complete len:108 gc:universal NODE_2589_length_1942_cov_15.472178:1735-1412(-)
MKHTAGKGTKIIAPIFFVHKTSDSRKSRKLLLRNITLSSSYQQKTVTVTSTLTFLLGVLEKADFRLGQQLLVLNHIVKNGTVGFLERTNTITSRSTRCIDHIMVTIL